MISVLVLTHNFPRFEGDHAGNFILYLYNGCKVRARIICPDDEAVKDSYAPFDIKRIKYWPGKRNTFYGGDLMYKKIMSLPKIFGFIFMAFLHCLMIPKWHEYDRVHVHWWFPCGVIAWLLYKTKGMPYMITSHGTDVFICQKYRFLIPIARKIFKDASIVTVVSSSIKKVLIETVGIKRDDIEIAPMPYNEDNFLPCSPMGRPDKPFRIMALGRLIERKGFIYLINAFREARKKLPTGSSLHIYGEGPEKSRLSSVIRQGEKIYLEGRLNPKAVNEHLMSAHLFVVPTITTATKETEGFGIVIIEAMASGTPVIATKTGGITDIIINGWNGCLVAEKDSDAMAEAIISLYANPDIRLRNAKNALHTASKFTRRAVGFQYKRYMSKIIKT